MKDEDIEYIKTMLQPADFKTFAMINEEDDKIVYYPSISAIK